MAAMDNRDVPDIRYYHENNDHDTLHGSQDWCTTVVRVAIDHGVTHIDMYTFADCANLKRVDMPNTVEHVGTGAFDGCTGLETIVFPASVWFIGHAVLDGCTNLRSVVIDNPDAVVVDHSDTTSVEDPIVGVHTPNLLSLVAPCIMSTTWITVICKDSPRIELIVASVSPVTLKCDSVRIHPDTPANRRRALLVQYWSCEAHRRCPRDQKNAIETILLARERLHSQFHLPPLPIEMWLAILSFLPRRPFACD